MKQKALGKGLAALTGVPAVLSTESAALDDGTSAAVANEYRRYERQILDFESEVTRRRDAMRGEHLGNLRQILGEAAE